MKNLLKTEAEALKDMRAKAAARQAKWAAHVEEQGLARMTFVIAICDGLTFKNLASASRGAQVIRNSVPGVSKDLPQAGAEQQDSKKL